MNKTWKNKLFHYKREKTPNNVTAIMCEQFKSEQQTRAIICHLLPYKTNTVLGHPHFTYLPVLVETATLPPPQLDKSTALVCRLDGRVTFCELKLNSSYYYSSSSAEFPNDFKRFHLECPAHSPT